MLKMISSTFDRGGNFLPLVRRTKEQSFDFFKEVRIRSNIGSHTGSAPMSTTCFNDRGSSMSISFCSVIKLVGRLLLYEES